MGSQSFSSPYDSMLLLESNHFSISFLDSISMNTKNTFDQYIIQQILLNDKVFTNSPLRANMTPFKLEATTCNHVAIILCLNSVLVHSFKEAVLTD